LLRRNYVNSFITFKRGKSNKRDFKELKEPIPLIIFLLKIPNIVKDKNEKSSFSGKFYLSK
uniref:hypothetical protein n=1 Tax=Okeania sp. SIO2F4 TaxID=2607790 RepID=UPI0025D74FA2